MFTDNKYYHWHNRIINRAKNREKPMSYCENHHILPKCFGGSNEKSNLVRLTTKEHFLIHLLLTKFTKSSYKAKMVYALWCMGVYNSRGKRILTSGQFTLLRKTIKHDEETRKKISMTSKGRKLSEEHKQKLFASRRGKINSPEARAKISASKLGKPRSEEVKAKIRAGSMLREQRKRERKLLCQPM